MYKSNMSHFNALMREIKYVIDTKHYCHQMKPDLNLNGPWEISGYSDAYYAVNKNTWKSVTGYIILIDVVVIVWRL